MCKQPVTHFHNVLSFPFSVNWVTVDGILYKKPCAVVFELGEDPVFAKLLGIYTTNYKDIHFHLKLFHTLEFVHHYHAYIIEPTSQTLTIKPSDFAYHLPLHIRVLPKSTGTLCVIPPHHFVSND